MAVRLQPAPNSPALRLPDSRVPATVGRNARLELVFAVRHGRTIVEHAYAEPPFRVGRAFDLNAAAYLIVVCAGPGVFGGDTLMQRVHVRPGARVVLTSQAALQIHPAPAPPAPVLSSDVATVQAEYVVEENAELHCQWDPVIPFAGARLDQKFDVRVDESSALYWSDAMMAGRVSRGEAWQFDSVAYENAVRVNGSLTYLERYALEPAQRSVDRRWAAGRARYFGTMLAYHRHSSSEIAERWHRRATECHPCVEAATDFVEPRLLVTRVTAGDGAPFARFRASNREAALDDIFAAPELAGRK